MKHRLAVAALIATLSAPLTPSQAEEADLIAPLHQEHQEDQGKRIVAEAEKYLGIPYQWNGRMTFLNPNLDCLGLLFLPYAAVFNFDWKKIPVDTNKELISSGLLGQPVAGLDGILREDLNMANMAKLQSGDALFFLVKNYDNPRDPPLLVRGTDHYRVWHTGLYAGNSWAIHAKPSEKVLIEPLKNIYFDALYATRRQH